MQHEPGRARGLTGRQKKFVQALAEGKTAEVAATEAGFSPSYAQKAATKIRKRPAVQQALGQVQAAARELAAYDLATAMQESLEVIAFAREHKNAMAYFKAVEHRAKLSGLLIERIHVEKVDIGAALAEARARIVNVTPQAWALPEQEETDGHHRGVSRSEESGDNGRITLGHASGGDEVRGGERPDIGECDRGPAGVDARDCPDAGSPIAEHPDTDGSNLAAANNHD